MYIYNAIYIYVEFVFALSYPPTYRSFLIKGTVAEFPEPICLAILSMCERSEHLDLAPKFGDLSFK